MRPSPGYARASSASRSRPGSIGYSVPSGVIQRGTVTVAGGRRAVATRTTAAATAAGSILGRPATFRPATRSVRTNVGRTADTVTPDPCNSPRTAEVRPRTACLVPPYSAAPGNGTRPASEAMLTTTPLPRASMSGSANRIPLTTPRRLTSTTTSSRSGSRSTKRPAGATPALFTSTSSGRAAPRKARNESRSGTSSGSPVPPSSAATALARSASTSPITIVAPSFPNARAVASPIPRAPPVTATTRPMPAPPQGRPLRVGDVDVVDHDVHRGHLEPEHLLHDVDDLAPHTVGDRVDHEPVLDDESDLDRRLGAVQPYRHALVAVGLAEADALLDRREHPGHVAAEVVHTGHTAGGDGHDLLDHLVGDDRGTAVGARLGGVATPVGP